MTDGALPLNLDRAIVWNILDFGRRRELIASGSQERIIRSIMT